MLVLTRAEGESIRIGEGVTVVVLEQRRRGRVRIGISAPPDVPIVRAAKLECMRRNGYLHLTSADLDALGMTEGRRR